MGRRALVAILVSVMTVGIMIGFMFPLLSLVLHSRGYSYSLIGVHSSLTSIAILMFGALMPKVLARVSVKQLWFLGCAFLIMAWLGLGFTSGIVPWFAFRLLLGAGIALVWIMSETWLNQVVTNENRGTVMGLYGTSFSVGLAIGPIILNIINPTGLLPFLVGAGLVLVNAVVYSFIDNNSVNFDGHDEHGVFEMAKKAPTFFMTALASGFTEVAVFALLPLYGEHIGLNQEKAIALFTFFVIGNIIFQPIIGWVAGKVGAQKIILISFLGALLSISVLPFIVVNYAILAVVMFVWGASVGGLYTAGVIGVGHYFNGKELGAANAGYIMMYALGMLTGPSVSGVMMQTFPPQGYIMSLASVSALGLIMLAIRGLKKS